MATRVLDTFDHFLQIHTISEISKSAFGLVHLRNDCNQNRAQPGVRGLLISNDNLFAVDSCAKY